MNMNKKSNKFVCIHNTHVYFVTMVTIHHVTFMLK